MSFSLGCAVWAYKDWIGDFYPPKSRATDFLKLYSHRFTTVEGNTTFYVIPSRETLSRWATETPEGFKFCLKLPRDFTHRGMLVPTIPQTLKFLEDIQELGSRLAPTFAQLPPSYSPDYLQDLQIFLRSLAQSQVPIALEVRHPDWFTEPYASELTNLLQELEIGRVLLDSRPIYDAPDDPQMHSERRKPKLPLQLSITANFSLIRFISHPDREWNHPYWQEWVTHVDRLLNQGIHVYFFVHCPQEERSPHNARYFQELLTKANVSVPELPWQKLEQPPTQLNLF